MPPVPVQIVTAVSSSTAALPQENYLLLKQIIARLDDMEETLRAFTSGKPVLSIQLDDRDGPGDRDRPGDTNGTLLLSHGATDSDSESESQSSSESEALEDQLPVRAADHPLPGAVGKTGG